MKKTEKDKKTLSANQEEKRRKIAEENREVHEAIQSLKDIYIKNVYDAIRLFPHFKKKTIIKACRVLWQDNPRRIADLNKDFPPK